MIVFIMSFQDLQGYQYFCAHKLSIRQHLVREARYVGHHCETQHTSTSQVHEDAMFWERLSQPKARLFNLGKKSRRCRSNSYAFPVTYTHRTCFNNWNDCIRVSSRRSNVDRTPSSVIVIIMRCFLLNSWEYTENKILWFESCLNQKFTRLVPYGVVVHKIVREDEEHVIG